MAPWLRRAVYILIVSLALINWPYWQTQLETPKIVSAPPEMMANMLIIERLGIETPIIYVERADEEAFQEGLENGVAHYPGTARIGENGNPYIFGHSSDYIWSRGRYKTILARLPRIKIGEEIIASDHAGKKFVYKVIETKVVSPKELSVLDQRGYQRKLLTVQTSYPVGTALRRFVAIAELVEK